MIVCLKFVSHLHAMAVLLFIVKEMENMISSTLMHSLQQCDFTKCLSDQDYYYLLIFILFLHTGISPKRKKNIFKNYLNLTILP